MEQKEIKQEKKKKRKLQTKITPPIPRKNPPKRLG